MRVLPTKICRRILASASIAMLMTGCASSTSFEGPPRLVRLAHVDGGVARQFDCENGRLTSTSTVNPQTNNLGYRFSAATCAAFDRPDDATAQRAMLEAGFTVVQVRCNDFFYQRAGNQTRAQVGRSLIAPVTAALTGIVGLINFKGEGRSDDVLAGLSIATAFATSSLNVYEEQFLFNANNINAVRGLTMRALSTHRAQTITDNPTTFDQTIRSLTDHQMICTPASILEMTRAAIDAGTVSPRTANAPAAAIPGAAASPATGEHITLDVGG